MKMRKTLASIIITVIFTSISVLAVYATSSDVTRTHTEIEEFTLSKNVPIIVSEEISLRDVNSKQFLMSDGTYAAVAYDIPVHYENNNRWIEIDNTLVSATIIGEFAIRFIFEAIL